MRHVYLFILFFLNSFGEVSFAHRRVLLVGGMVYPPKAMEKFVGWAGGKHSHILIVSWGGMGHEEATFNRLKRHLLPYDPGQVVAAPKLEEMPAEREKFLQQLQKSTAVFFTGGCQHVLMETIKNSDLLEALRTHFKNDHAFGGASAGTAIMGNPMITSQENRTAIGPNEVELEEGLGLVTEMLVDQHFIERGRQNRLLSALLRNKSTLGIGVDEGSAISIEDNHLLTVHGESLGSIFKIEERGHFSLYLLEPERPFNTFQMK